MDLFSSHINPKLLWQLPKEQRWDYVAHAEQLLIDLIKDEIRITPHQFSEGFAPSHDVRVNVPDEECTIDLEIKFTKNSDIFIECAYGNGNDSGLLASKSDFYLVVSTGLKNETEPVGKVRLYANWRLIEYGNYIIEQKGIKSYEASDMSPGSHGFYVNSKAFDKFYGADSNACIWIGNIAYHVDKNDDVVYDLSKFTDVSLHGVQYFMRDVRKINRMKEQGLSNV